MTITYPASQQFQTQKSIPSSHISSHSNKHDVAKFESLPEIAILKILSYLDLKDRILITRVASWFIPLIDHLWLIQKSISFQYSSKPVFDNLSTIIVKDVQEDKFINLAKYVLHRSPRLKQVYFSRQFDGELLARLCPHVEIIASQDLHLIKNYVDSIKIDDQDNYLKSITFVRGYKTNMYNLPSLEFLSDCKNLKELSLFLTDSNLNAIPKCVIDKLYKLSLNGVSYNCNRSLSQCL